ncbi:hypothetical protein [Streptomyces sp. NPDC005078]|uniref:hypothetical protein n=1 Tax=unclassified Streptomyces TaxID=2593676 RepID=UPI00339EEF7C
MDDLTLERGSSGHSKSGKTCGGVQEDGSAVEWQLRFPGRPLLTVHDTRWGNGERDLVLYKPTVVPEIPAAQYSGTSAGCPKTTCDVRPFSSGEESSHPSHKLREGMALNNLPHLTSTGTCWCGCGTKVGTGSFFAPGHDKVAEAALLAAEYGSSIPQLLHLHGYGPDRSITAQAVESGVWQQCPSCEYVGAPASVRNHEKKAHQKGL